MERHPTLPRLAKRAMDISYFWRRMQTPGADWPSVLRHHRRPNHEEARFKNRIVMWWDTSTRWVPSGRLYLLRRTVP